MALAVVVVVAAAADVAADAAEDVAVDILELFVEELLLESAADSFSAVDHVAATRLEVFELKLSS